MAHFSRFVFINSWFLQSPSSGTQKQTCAEVSILSFFVVQRIDRYCCYLCVPRAVAVVPGSARLHFSLVEDPSRMPSLLELKLTKVIPDGLETKHVTG